MRDSKYEYKSYDIYSFLIFVIFTFEYNLVLYLVLYLSFIHFEYILSKTFLHQRGIIFRL